MLEFSEESKRLVSTFLTYRNDIDIFTEDEIKDREFYRVLLSRLLDYKIVINDITPLGCKDNVIERCKSEPDNGRKKIFIIDGDINLIHGKNIPTVDNLFVLDAYCIENCLLDKHTIIQFIYLNCGVKSYEEIEGELQFEKWLDQYSDALIELYIHFAIVDVIGGNFTLGNAHMYHTNTSDGYVFNESQVRADVELLRNRIIEQVGNVNYNALYIELKAKWGNNVDNLLTIISAKDYLIPMLLIKTLSFKKSKAIPSLAEVKISLVQFCGLSKLAKLRKAIEAL